MSASRGPTLLAVVALAALTAGCAKVSGDDTGSGGIAHATGPNQLVLRVDSCCGFVPVDAALTAVPGLSLFGDGSLVITGPQIEIYPGPALPNLQVRHIGEDGVQAILQAARDAGLQGQDQSYDTANVADASTTTFTVAAGGDVHVTSVYALYESRDGTPESEDEARRALYEFSQKLGDLESWLPSGSVGLEEPFEYHGLRVFVMPGFPEDNEELSQPEKEWPVTESLATFGEPLKDHQDIRCGVVDGDDFQALRPLAEGANQLTPWVSDGKEYHLVFRPLLPDESGC
jgi:hypothetical protein